MGRKNFGVKTYLYPMPVLIIGSYDENETANAMNAAWGGIADYNQIFVALSDHRTTRNILKTQAFTISVATAKMLVACDYVGLVSQDNEADKMQKAGFTVTKSTNVNAPIINELPLTIECKMVSFNEETGILVGEIINVSCDEDYLTNGNIDPQKIEPITYDPVNHNYIKLGLVAGKAFSDGLKLK